MLPDAHLAIVAPSAYPLGGVQTWLDQLVPGLIGRGWKVTVHLSQGRWSDAESYLRQHPMPCPVSLVVSPTGSREGRVRALIHSLAAASPNLVLNVNLVDVYEAANRLKLAGNPLRVVAALHGLQPCFFNDIASWSGELDGTICVSKLAALASQRLAGIPGERVFHAPCGVDMLNPSARPANAQGLDLLYVGRFDQVDKRVLDIPPIVRHLERRGVPFRLRMVGAGPEEHALREALQGCQSVEFCGYVEPARLRESFYQAGCVLLITSPSETGPLVAWEAMAAGGVVVSSRFLGMRQENALVDESNCLTFPIGDALAAAEAIARLLDPGLRDRLSRAALQTAATRFDTEASVAAWDRALRALLALPQRPAHERSSAQPAGRLDRCFGIARAETLRWFLRRRHDHVSAGGEWPHTANAAEDTRMSRMLKELDESSLAEESA